MVTEKAVPLRLEGGSTLGRQRSYNIMLCVNRFTTVNSAAHLTRPVSLSKAKVKRLLTERITNQTPGVVLVEAIETLKQYVRSIDALPNRR